MRAFVKASHSRKVCGSSNDKSVEPARERKIDHRCQKAAADEHDRKVTCRGPITGGNIMTSSTRVMSQLTKLSWSGRVPPLGWTPQPGIASNFNTTGRGPPSSQTRFRSGHGLHMSQPLFNIGRRCFPGRFWSLEQVSAEACPKPMFKRGRGFVGLLRGSKAVQDFVHPQ